MPTIVGQAVNTVEYLDPVDGTTYMVSVDLRNVTNIPEGAELYVEEVAQSKYDSYLNQAAKALKTNADAFTYAKLLDISIVYEGQKIQPNGKVGVEIQLKDGEDISNPQVVHFGKEPEVLDAAKTGNGVAFETSGFSIYAVVGEDDTSAYARMNLHFMNGEEEVAMMIVKNGDTREELNTIIYDPGVGTIPEGQIFKGWSTTADYTVADAENGMNIEEVRDWAADYHITENEDVYLYAMLYKNFVINYLDENNVGVGSENVFMLSTDSSSPYTVNMAYTPKDDTHAFLGWNVSEGGNNIQGHTEGRLYENGTDITITGKVTFSVNAPEGHWLVFDENGKGGTYNAPRFVKSEDVTEEPRPDSEMTRFGYTFAGWYALKAGVSIDNVPKTSEGYYDVTNTQYFEPFTFGNTISDRTTLYANWTAAETANYTVIIWKEKSQDTYANNRGEYEDEGGETVTREPEYDFWKAYNLTGNVGDPINAVSDSTTSTTDVNGTYYDVRIRGTQQTGGNVNEVVSETGYHAARYDTSVTIVPEGTSIVNVYYDRHTVTYTFHYPYGYTYTALSEEDNDNNPEKYGDVNGQKARVYWRNGAFRTSNNNYGTVYNGTVYTRGNNQSWQTYQEEIGLYGEKLNWPTDTSIWWYPNGNNGSTSGTRMTYKNDFIPMDADMSVDYYGTTGSGTQEIRFYTQDLNDPNNYTMQYSVPASNVGSFNVNDKFTGFHAYQTRSYTDGHYERDWWGNTYWVDGSWSNWADVGALNPSTGVYGDAVDVNSILEIRYNRISNTIAYMDGKYVDGNNNPINEGNQGELHETAQMFYETDLTSYNKNGANYYTPPANKTPAGYVFEGWYADEACTHEYTFTTMPVSGVTVYAKWRKIQYRVFLHPNADQISDLDWGSENQAMNFRVSIGDKVDTPEGRSTEWEFVGWYTDPSCSASSLYSDDMVLNESTVNAKYDKTTDFTDPMDKWGNLTGPGENSDIERFWITKKLDLYGKWRAKLIGAKGIGIMYDAVEGSNAPTDKNQYLDQAQATAGAASTAPEGKQFVKWVVQIWDSTQNKYIDKTDASGDIIGVYPGDSFEVLKKDAKYVITGYANPEDPTDISKTQDATHSEIVATYTVQLRAEYIDTGAGVPTHINWYGNNETEATAANQFVVTDNNVLINQAIDAKPATTFSYEGHKFLGWARVPISDNEGNPLDPTLESELSGKNLSLEELGVEDLFLKYVEATEDAPAHFEATSVTTGATAGSTVSKVAPDERYPYHAMVAVWETLPVTLKITKKVGGSLEYITVPADGFHIKVTLDNAIIGDVGISPEDGTVTKAEDAGNVYELYLKANINNNKVSATFTVPYGTKYSVEEIVQDIDNRYTVAYAVNEISCTTVSDRTIEQDTEVIITNEAPEITKAGLDVDTTAARTALLSLFAFAMMCVLGFSLKRRYVSRR